MCVVCVCGVWFISDKDPPLTKKEGLALGDI